MTYAVRRQCKTPHNNKKQLVKPQLLFNQIMSYNYKKIKIN